MDQLRIWLCGPPRVERRGRPVEVDTRKAIALLAYLAVTARPHGRDELAALLWPDYEQARARAALRRTLSTLKAALGGAWLTIGRTTLTLEHDDVWLDVDHFGRRVGEWRDHGHPEEVICDRCVAALEEASELCRGEFMAGFSLRDSPIFDDWQSWQAEELRRQLAGALDRLVRGLAASGRFEDAIDHARRWLSLDLLHEPAHRALMRLYSWSSRRADAIRQYRSCVAILDRELGVGPLDETVDLYRAIEMDALEAPASSSPQEPDRPHDGVQSPPLGPPLVGREPDLEALRRAWAEIRDGGRFVAVTGEAGVGKTRLVEAAMDGFKSEGSVVLAARCYPGESTLAYAPITALLRAGIGPGGAPWSERVPVRWLSEASRLAPELSEFRREAMPAEPSDDPGARARFYEGVAGALAEACRSDRPGVLFVDDLHWADEASLDFIAYLLRRLDDRPLMVVAAWRSEDVPADHRISLMLFEAARAGVAQALTLRRLTAGDVAQLVAKSLPEAPGELVERVHRETDGLPFFVTEYLAAIREGDQSGEWPLPRGVRDLLTGRLATVGDVARQLLGAAAVIGTSFDYDTLRAASGRSEDETIAALDELVGRGLVAEDSSGGDIAYDFTHDKVRELVYDQAGSARRKLLHARVADELSGRTQRRDSGGMRAASAARHYQAAGRLDEAATWYRRAGDEARRVYANREALTHYGEALACGHREVGYLHEGIGDLHTLAGDYARALESYEAAAASAEGAALAGLEQKIGTVHERRGDWGIADAHYQAAEAALPDGEAEGLRARILVNRSLTAHRRRDDDEAMELADAALSLAERASDGLALAQVYNIRGILATGARAVEELESSLAYASATGDITARVAALNNLARALAASGQPERAMKTAEEAIELCAAFGDRHREAALRNNLADLLHALGRGDEAVEQLKRAVALFAEVGEPGALEPGIWKLVDW